jgi:hypothetical protein
MVRRKTVSLVSMWDVLDHIGFTDDQLDQLCDWGFNGVTWGDSAYTLIGNNYALRLIQDGNEALENPLDSEEIAKQFWQVVGEDDYINMEDM